MFQVSFDCKNPINSPSPHCKICLLTNLTYTEKVLAAVSAVNASANKAEEANFFPSIASHFAELSFCDFFFCLFELTIQEAKGLNKTSKLYVLFSTISWKIVTKLWKMCS